MAETYDYEVVEEVKEDFYCVICLNLMKEAMQLKCGHGMCKSCLDDLRNNSRKRGVAFICPSCRDEIDSKELKCKFDKSLVNMLTKGEGEGEGRRLICPFLTLEFRKLLCSNDMTKIIAYGSIFAKEFIQFEETIHPVIMINRIISSVKVKCENSKKGCTWIGELGNLKDHLNMECSFYPISCSFKHCEKKIERYALADHQNICPYKTETCCYCKFVCLSSELPEHYHTCERYPVKCPNECSDELMEQQVNALVAVATTKAIQATSCWVFWVYLKLVHRLRFDLTKQPIKSAVNLDKFNVCKSCEEDVKYHRRMCSKEIVKCEFSSFGCDFMVLPNGSIIQGTQDVFQR
ncbi:RING finger protein DG17-like [Hydractinia symbiolongicarpus]|uniref:RING finger protein DG17-like n=1 Tax=Hydractinia symbiolongicarpus TaxID=13093 RepID=UPI00254A274B|nr:RING finger protein DG17-like [Hydractinia symbiolongicarpus]